MNTLYTLQKSFKDLLLTEVLQKASSRSTTSNNTRCKLNSYSENEREARLAIYKNNVHHSLALSLKDLFPSIVKALGSEFFTALSQAFIARNPPNTSSLVFFGKEFISFLSNFEHTKEYLYLSDLAAIDYYRHKSYHAKDQNIINIEQASQIDPSQLGDSRITFTNATYFIHSSWKVFSLWQHIHEDKNEKEDEKISVEGIEDVLIYRDSPENNFRIQTLSIHKDLNYFLVLLEQKMTISEALEETLNKHTKFEPSSAIAFLFSHPIVHQLINETE